jgi:hypothetical protein
MSNDENLAQKTILILSVNPKDTARRRLDEEHREIDEGLKRAKNRQRFSIQAKWAIRLRDLRRAMLDHEPQIVHFCGHGYESGLLVEDETGKAKLVSKDAISGLFALFADQIECVLLNASCTQKQTEAIAKHIKYVIGMRKPLSDKAALEFAIGFYDAIGAGKNIDDAFKFGCNALQLYGIPNHLTPILQKEKGQLCVENFEEELDGKKTQNANLSNEKTRDQPKKIKFSAKLSTALRHIKDPLLLALSPTISVVVMMIVGFIMAAPLLLLIYWLLPILKEWLEKIKL